jgi:ankyrin repeat protein
MNNNFNSLDDNGNNMIHKLVKKNNSKLLKEKLEILLEKGKLKNLVNQKNYFGYTPLHCAIKNHNQECAQILINNGADTRIITDNGYCVKYVEDTSQKGGKYQNSSKEITGIRFI